MKKLLLVLVLGMILISGVTALESLGTFKQNELVRLKQVCEDATYINISSVTYPNSTVAYSNKVMADAGSGEFYFDYNKTDALGTYQVNGISDGCVNTFSYYFDITPSGQGGVENIIFVLFVILALYGLNLFGFFGKNETLTILGGMALMFLGVYLIINGVIIYRDNLTNYFAYITIGWGFVSTMMATDSMIRG